MEVDTQEFRALRQAVTATARVVIGEFPVDEVEAVLTDDQAEQAERIVAAVYGTLVAMGRIDRHKRPGHGRHAAATSLRLAVLGWRW